MRTGAIQALLTSLRISRVITLQFEAILYRVIDVTTTETKPDQL